MTYSDTSTSTTGDWQVQPAEWNEWLSAVRDNLSQREAALRAERASLEAELRAMGIEGDDPIQALFDSIDPAERDALVAQARAEADAMLALPISAPSSSKGARKRAGRSFL